MSEQIIATDNPPINESTWSMDGPRTGCYDLNPVVFLNNHLIIEQRDRRDADETSKRSTIAWLYLKIAFYEIFP